MGGGLRRLMLNGRRLPAVLVAPLFMRIGRRLPVALFTALLILGARSLSADGLIVVPDAPHPVPGHFPFAPLEVSFHKVTVEITDLVAVTSVEQEFFNRSDDRLEGTYIFPLPDQAHIDRFSMDVNGRMLDAELLPAADARRLYEEIVRKARDPALLEYAGRGAFKVRVFPIEPRSAKRIRIRYTQLLKSDGGLVEYLYPLNTEKFSSAPLNEVSIKVTVNGREPLKSLYSPTHDVEIRREGETRAVLGYEARNIRPDSDFKLLFSRRSAAVSIDLLTSRTVGEDGYFMLLASPGARGPGAQVQPKDVCFVLDTSGSMASGKLVQAKKALRSCLENLGESDRFQVIRFSTEAEALFETAVPASRANLDVADRFIEGMRPIGGTAIADALQLALRSGRAAVTAGAPGRPYLVIFLTDGLPTVGETREEAIVTYVKDSVASGASRSARIFAFGIGSDVNTHLLDRMAEETRGSSQYVLPGEDIELRVASLAARISDPVLSDVSLRFTNPAVRLTNVLPAALPDLFSGDMLIVFGRYSGSGVSAVEVSGMLNGRREVISAEVRFPSSSAANDFVPRLWATRRVGWLLDQIRINGASAELEDEVTILARKFGIVTPYTALLVLEDEGRRGVPQALRSYQELERDNDALGGARRMMDSVKLEAASEGSRSGMPAVENSLAVQQMKKALNESQVSAGAGFSKSGAGASDGKAAGYQADRSRTFAGQVRLANGRAFYQNGNIWTDSTAQSQKGLKERKVLFNSKEYFQLLSKYPSAAQWLALGNELDVVLDGTLYSIREN